MQSSENCCYSQSYKKSDNFVSEMKTEHQNKHILYGINEVAEVKSFTEKTIKEYVAQMQFSKLKGVLPGKKITEKPNLNSLLENENQSFQPITEESRKTKYTWKSYSSCFLVVTVTLCILTIYFYYFVYSNFFCFAINMTCSGPGKIIKFPCSRRLRTLFSYKKFGEKTESIIKSLSACFNARIFKSPLNLLTTFIRDGFYSCLLFYAFYLLCFIFVDGASYVLLSYFLAFFVSFLM